ncbi:alpha/beta hydrolase family protein [Sarocladium implicatum]|nr:alpha/beta hydrolase family protein [Sarocladium implicatum]
MSAAGEYTAFPRPGPPESSPDPIPAPSEAAFTQTFGQLLPPAKFINTAKGKAAYYEFPSSTSSSASGGDSAITPRRVVLVHGVQTPGLGMYPLSRALRESFPGATFVILDLWGHGLSDALAIPHTPQLFQSLLDQLLDTLEWPSAHLVGYSFGAVVSAGYTANHSRRVQSLTLVAPAGFIRSGAFSSEEQGHLKYDSDEVAARDWVIEFLEGGKLVVPQDWKQRVEQGHVVAEAVRDWQTREHPGHTPTVVAVLRDGGALDFHAEYRKTAQTGVPSLVVLGELDDLSSEKEVKEHGFGNVAIVPQAGHAVVRKQAPEVGAFICKFWAELDKSS